MKNNFKLLKFIIGVFNICPPCADDEDIPSYLCDPCESLILPGGIGGLILKKCSYDFLSILDENEWGTAVAAKNVSGRVNCAMISGGLPEPEAITKVYGACQKTVIRKQTRKITLTDVENDSAFSIDSFYNYVNKNYSKYQIGFISSDGRFIGWHSINSFWARMVIEDTNDGDSMWMVDITYEEPLGQFLQTQISFLNDIVLNVCWVTSIVVTGAGGAITVADGLNLQMSAAILPANATNPAVVWSVINGSGTATISVGGLLTATSVGTVSVVATAADGSGITGILTITVTP